MPDVKAKLHSRLNQEKIRSSFTQHCKLRNYKHQLTQLQRIHSGKLDKQLGRLSAEVYVNLSFKRTPNLKTFVTKFEKHLQ